MIAVVRGLVLDAGLDRLVVEVGGVGLLVHTTPGTAAAHRAGSMADLATTLVVREDSLTLYGFAAADERTVFETVQTVPGVGPRLALAMLAVLEPDAIREALTAGDATSLMKVPGIGRKSAERLILELRDRLPAAAAGTPAAAAAPRGTPPSRGREQVREALVGLGWSAKQADSAIDAVAGDVDADADVPGVLKAALRELGR